MIIKKCRNKHFYDGENFSECPACNPELMDRIKTEYAKIYSEALNQTSSPAIEPEATPVVLEPAVISPVVEEPAVAETVDEPVIEPVTEVIEEPAIESVTETIEEVIADEEPELIEDIEIPEGIVTGFPPISSLDLNVPPVVGWLVCVGGPHFGEAFPLNAGANTVGANSGNKIVISKDYAISSEAHFAIKFNVSTDVFSVEGNVCVNGDLISDEVAINDGDEIEAGDSKFVVKSLCGDRFDWSKFII